MAIRFHHGKGGFAKDETVTVVAVESDSLKVQRTDGTETIFPLGQAAALSARMDVGEHRKLKIAAGDKLLLQANAARKRFINGELVEVRAVQGDSVVLADGRVIVENYRTFTHGYAVTSHAAQGKTVDEVLVVASSRSLPAVSQQQFYVSISRGRERCQVFTDDVERLRSHVTHSSERLAAIEGVSQVHRQRFLQRILQRGHRFLNQFRQRLTQQQTFSRGQSGQPIKLSNYEHQPQTTRRISV